MRETDLPSPDVGGTGFMLRRVAATAISEMQVSAPHYTTGQHPKAAALKAFFDACSAAAAALNLITPVLTFTPTAKTYSIATGANQAGPTLGKGGSTGAVTYTSSDPTKATVNASGQVTPLVAGSVTITASVAADATYRAATKTYTATITA